MISSKEWFGRKTVGTVDVLAVADGSHSCRFRCRCCSWSVSVCRSDADLDGEVGDRPG
jgi:hypothetical protein